MTTDIVLPGNSYASDIADSVNELLNNPKELYRGFQRTMDITHHVGHLLPMLFRFNGFPVTLERHFQLEPVFYHNRPRQVLLKCARQVGKSFQQALLVIMRALMIPNWNLLYVTPFYETVRRFSSLYVKGLIEDSPVKRLLQRKGASSQVLQRTFNNNSTLFFSFAFRDANRTRGINSNENFYDEIQLMSHDVLEILTQTMSGSMYGEYEMASGTPLSFQNIIEKRFKASTMSEWMIKCRSCGYENRSSIEFDLIKMIGPVHADIHAADENGPGMPGLVCARCSKSDPRGLKPLFPEDGRWFHRAPERRETFLGLHVPQPIMSWHAYSYDRWVKLNNRLAGDSEAEVYNEVLGESADSGFKPISETDIRRACVLGHNGHSISEAFAKRSNYQRLAMGIDWGGGGKSNVSRTKAAIIGLDRQGRTDVIYGLDLNLSHLPMEEVRMLVLIARHFNVDFIAHDAGGGVGATRESLMIQTGALSCPVLAMTYVGPMANAMIKYHEPDLDGASPYYTIDKSRSISFTCQAIQQGHVRFFDYDYKDENRPGLLIDFTALTSEVAPRVMGSDILIIGREDTMSDDFAHAVNLGACMLWGQNDCWPKIGRMKEFTSAQQLADLNPTSEGTKYTSRDIEEALRRVKRGNFADR